MASETFLTAQIEASKSSEKIENEVKSYLNEAKLIMENVKDDLWKDHEMYQRFEEEYDELRWTIKNSLDHGREFSKKERMSIMLELWDIVELADDQWVDTSGSGWDHFTKNLFWSDTNWALDKVEWFLSKDISEYSIDEAEVILEHLNKEYWDFEEWNFAWTDEENISDLADKKDVNVYQDRLIAKILWTEEKWFNNEYLKWYNNKEWNYLISIEKFEQKVKDDSININDINSNELANYFAFLSSKWQLNIDTIAKKIWTKQIKQLNDLVDSPIWDDRWLREILSEYSLDKILKDAKNIELSITDINSIKELNSINYNSLDISTIKNNLNRTVPNITEPTKILELLDSGIILAFTQLHKDLIMFPEVVERFQLTIIDINRYSVDDLCKNKELIIALINTDKSWNILLPHLVNKLKSEINNNSHIKKLFIDNISETARYGLPEYISNIVYEQEVPKTKEELNVILRNIKNNPNDIKLADELTNFLLESNIDDYEYQIVEYIKNWWKILWPMFFNLLNKNIAQTLLYTENWENFAHFFPAEIYNKHPFLFEIVIDKKPIKDIQNFINIVDFPNFETVLYTIESIEKRKGSNDDNIVNSLYSNAKFRQKIMDILVSTKSFECLPSQKQLVENIVKSISDQNEKISTLMEVQSKISHHIDQMTEENKLAQLEESFIQKLSVEWIKINNTEITELINLLTQTDINSKKLFIEKINSMDKLDTNQKNKLIETLSDIKLYTISQNIQKNINWTDINPELSRKTLINNFNKFWWDIDIYINSLWLTGEEKKEAEKVLTKYQEDKIQLAQAVVIKNCSAIDNEWNLIFNEEEYQKQVQEELQNFDVEEFTQQYDVDEKLTEIFTQKYIEHKNLEFLEEINSIDSQSQLWVNTQEDKKTYSYAWLTYEIPDVAVNNNFSIINYQTGEKIEISKDEKETIQEHPEALKNLIDTKQKLEKLGLDFVWNNREEFLFLMKNDDKFNDTGKIETTDNDYLNISEFNHLLQFVLYKTTGDTNTNDYYTNMSKIRQINGENELNEKRNFVSGLSNIWQKFVELWFLTESGTLNFHWVNTKNYSEITWPGFQKAA